MPKYLRTKRTTFLRIVVLLLLLPELPVFAQQPRPGFSSQGDWHYSFLAGPEADKQTLWSSDPRATATWNPQLKSVGPVRISFYVIGSAGNVPNPRLIVVHAGRTDTTTVSMGQTSSGWVPVGIFDFKGVAPEYVQIAHGADPGNLRVAGLRLEVLDPNNQNVVWQNLVLTDIAPGNPGQDQTVINFQDVGDSSAKHAAGILASTAILPGTSATQFSPQQPLSPADLASALTRMGKAKGLSLSSASLSQLQGQHTLTGRQFLAAIVETVRGSGRDMEWPHANSKDPAIIAQQMGLLNFTGASGFSSLPSVNRANAALLLFSFEQIVADSGPPVTGQWRLSFDEEFNGSSVDWNIWNSDHGAVRGLSSRWPENAVVSNGILHLVIKQENRGGTSWTTANLWTKNFEQKYGYWEARFRYAAAPGLNNAFWMIHGINQNDNFEIDVNEGHYPNEVNSTLHQVGLPDSSTRYLGSSDLSQEFHTYGCLWNQQQIIFYMDGKEIARKPNTKANDLVPVLLSTAVIPWAGAQTKDLNGKSMDVDWVRVYTLTQ